MYTEMTTIKELTNKGMLSANTQMILNNANVHTLGELSYDNPYCLSWQQLPGMNWDVYNDIMDLFIRLDTEKALANPQLKASQYENLPKRFQSELDANYDVAFDDMELFTYLIEHGMTVEKLHNGAINSPYAILRLVRDFDFAENTLMRRYLRDYLNCEIYAMRNDCYSQVREIYAMRQTLIPQKFMNLSPEEILAFFMRGKLKQFIYDDYHSFINVIYKEPIYAEIQKKFIQTPNDLVLLFQKPQEAFHRLVGKQYEKETINNLMSYVDETYFHLSDQIKDWLDDDECDPY